MRRPARVGHRTERGVADAEIAGKLKNLLPIFVFKRCRGERPRLKTKQSSPDAGPSALIQMTGKNLLLDARGVTGDILPAGSKIDLVEFAVRFEIVHVYDDLLRRF